MHHPPELFNNYQALRNSRLVKDKNTDSDALEYFAKYLNQACPVTESHKANAALLRGIYRTDPNGFNNLLRNNPNLRCLVLWTEGRCIVNHFRIQNLVMVTWNDGVYTVTLKDIRSSPAQLEQNDDADDTETPVNWGDASDEPAVAKPVKARKPRRA
jgi:hypothetical protein